MTQNYDVVSFYRDIVPIFALTVAIGSIWLRSEDNKKARKLSVHGDLVSNPVNLIKADTSQLRSELFELDKSPSDENIRSFFLRNQEIKRAAEERINEIMSSELVEYAEWQDISDLLEETLKSSADFLGKKELGPHGVEKFDDLLDQIRRKIVQAVADSRNRLI